MNNEPVAWTGQNTFCKYCHRIPSQCCCPPAKTLTDEEIEGIARANVDGHSSMEQLKWFARAILRKAQEK